MRRITLTLCLLGLVASGAVNADEREDLLELQLTVVNLLESLVEREVLTREEASLLVSQAQASAEERVAAERAAEPALNDDDVRVTYVPEIVREQIREELREEMAGEIVAAVKADARDEGWGIPASLPDWIGNVRIGGDLRLRAEGNFFGSDNAQNTYLDFEAVNAAGGIDRAGITAIRNTTEDRTRFRGAVRVDLAAELGDSFDAYMRVSTGNIEDPQSRNQDFGRYSASWQTNIDRAYLRWQSSEYGRFRQSATFGRMFSPWSGTDLLWDPDIGFEGVYYEGAARSRRGSGMRLGMGYFPIKEVDISSDDGWLASAELRADLAFGDNSNLYLAAAYHHFENITGIRNAPESDLTDFTAPPRLARGNTLFDIRNDLDPTTNLFALAAEYQLLNVTTGFTTRFPTGMPFEAYIDYVQNIGYDEDDVLRRTGLNIDERNEGYAAYLRFGPREPQRAGEWSVETGYRYLQRDAVLDAWTDSNFGLGGTDTQGYSLRVRYGFLDDAWLDVRWLSSSEIDGPPLTIDSLLIDLNTRF